MFCVLFFFSSSKNLILKLRVKSLNNGNQNLKSALLKSGTLRLFLNLKQVILEAGGSKLSLKNCLHESGHLIVK